MKIAIIGSPGSGKSIVAVRLHTLLGLPLHHLDQYFWKPGWQRLDRDEFEKIHKQLCDNDQWIIEGMAKRFFAYRLQQADVIIFLDVGLWRCLYRLFKRAILGWGTVRESSAAGCPEKIPDREFLSYVLNFHTQQRLELQMLLKQYQGQKKIFVIKNQKQLDEFLSTWHFLPK